MSKQICCNERGKLCQCKYVFFVFYVFWNCNVSVELYTLTSIVAKLDRSDVYNYLTCLAKMDVNFETFVIIVAIIIIVVLCSSIIVFVLYYMSLY